MRAHGARWYTYAAYDLIADGGIAADLGRLKNCCHPARRVASRAGLLMGAAGPGPAALLLLVTLAAAAGARGAIDRRALVARHSPRITCAMLHDEECSGLNFQTLGNGNFAFSVDVTGLQTLNRSIPVAHAGAGDQKTLDCPFNTMSNWGWHTTPVEKSRTPQANVSGWQDQEITSYGHQSAYPTGCGGAFEGDAASCPLAKKQSAYSYLRANPHRINLGRLFLASNASTGGDLSTITNVSQHLDMWSGKLESNFSLGQQQEQVQVTTAVGTDDVVAVRLRSELLSHGLHLQLAFPYGSEDFSGNGADWDRPQDHSSTLSVSPAPEGGVHARITRRLDGDSYSVLVHVEGAGGTVVAGAQPHLFDIRPPPGEATTELQLTVSFSAEAGGAQAHGYITTLQDSAEAWERFWTSGAAIEFVGSLDPRAALLEKQVVMSMYMFRSQEAGSLPPQETGLTTNSWYGKFHGEMRMWHQSWFVPFGHPEIFARSTEYYLRLLGEAKAYARLQGFRGARWFKMRAAQTLRVFTGPSAVGPFLLQEQPHPIIYAELLYRAANTSEARSAALEKYGELVQATADFMASFVLMSSGHATRNCTNLGPPLLPGMGVENDDPGNSASPMTTLNGVYELTYFRYTLGVAQAWRQRRGLALDPHMARVLATMCLPRTRRWKNASVYFFTDASTELIGNATALGQVYSCAHVPCMSAGIHRDTMRATLRLSVDEFNFNNAYPGDDRAYAMAAARLGEADIALEMLLKNAPTNTFNEKNGQWQGFFPLLTSSNGQLMYAVAMLAGGWDGDAGGFAWPRGWDVKAEGFMRLLTDDDAAATSFRH